MLLRLQLKVMGQWNTPEWEALRSGEACPICRQGRPFGIVAELQTSYLTSGPDGVMRGNCSLVLKRHAVELFDLDPGEACAFMQDLQRAAAAVQEVTGAVKMNYEIHGNTIPHLHVHLYPRYRGDPFEHGPIDPKAVTASPYAEGEFDAFVRALQARLSEDGKRG